MTEINKSISRTFNKSFISPKIEQQYFHSTNIKRPREKGNVAVAYTNKITYSECTVCRASVKFPATDRSVPPTEPIPNRNRTKRELNRANETNQPGTSLGRRKASVLEGVVGGAPGLRDQKGEQTSRNAAISTGSGRFSQISKGGLTPKRSTLCSLCSLSGFVSRPQARVQPWQVREQNDE